MVTPVRFTIHENNNHDNTPLNHIIQFIEFVSNSESLSTFEITPLIINNIFNENIVVNNELDIKSEYFSDIGTETCQECTICYEKYKENSSVSILNCQHFFHTDCIKKWGKRSNTCPICREEIPLIE